VKVILSAGFAVPCAMPKSGQGDVPECTGAAESPVVPVHSAEIALSLRDQALAALDAGDPVAALAAAKKGLAVLAADERANTLDEAALLIALAEIEEELGQFAAARATAATAVAVLGDVAPNDEPDSDDWLLLWCQGHERLAGLERVAGDFASATARLDAVLAEASGKFGESSLPVVSAANALGVVYKYAGDFGTAEASYRRALAALDRLTGTDPVFEAGLLHNLGGLAHSRGEPDAGILHAERGVAVRVAALGERHPDVARDLNALGALYHQAGRLAEAEQAYRQALAVFEDAYGTDHFEVGMTCANLAVLHSDHADHASAEALGRRALNILESVLGPNDAEVGLTLLNLVTAAAGQDRPEEAAALATNAAAILQARLPDGHPHGLAASATLETCGRES
jgi:tetratricopeptide (TPR) repeat protein